MATFLEGRLLDNLDQQLLGDLTKSYRNLVRVFHAYLNKLQNEIFIFSSIV